MIKLELTIEEVNLILVGLQELPAKLSLQLILKLQNEGQKQFDEQNKQKVESVK
jgi:hypothetical protein